MNLLRPCLIALQFLTLLPITLKSPPKPEESGQSLLYYPLAGFLIGSLMVLVALALQGAPTTVAAMLLVSLWALSTGALHLDGLADSADAWIGAPGNKEKTLTIMKDPRCGAVAVVTLILTLMIKFSAVEQLLMKQSWELLLLIPVLARALLILLFLTTPYVRRNGLGDQIANNLPRQTSLLVLAAILLASSMFAFTLVLISAATFLVLRHLMLRRLGGTTGDTAGALVEISEVALLVGAALISS